MGDIERDTRPLKTGESSFEAEIVTDWDILVPNGGYLAGIAVRSIGAALGDDWVPASMSARFLRRAAIGMARIETVALRTGSSARAFRASIHQGDAMIVDVTVWSVRAGLVAGRLGPVMSRPTRPTPDELVDLEYLREKAGLGRARGGLFQNIEERPFSWTPPNERSEDSRGEALEAWIKFRGPHREYDPWLNAACAAVLIDAYPFLALTRSHPLTELKQYPVTLELCISLETGVEASDWTLIEASCPPSGGPLLYGTGKISNQTGALLAQGSERLLYVPFKD